MDGSPSTFEAVAKIIAAAATSNLGIVALLVIVVGALAYRFFRNTHVAVRIFIFLVLFAGAAAFGAAVILERSPVLAELPSAPRTEKTAATQISNPAAAPAPAGVDLACVSKRLEELRDPQKFAQAGGVGCKSAGLSAHGTSNSAVIAYRAPPGYSIVGPVSVADVSRIDGEYGAIKYVREGERVVEARVPVSCRSEDKPFGAGASMRISLSGLVERPVSNEARQQAIAECTH